jgi:hypothetical protein
VRILAAILAFWLVAAAREGDFLAGERTFYTHLADTIGLNGADFAIRHTAQEWEALFENRGEGFIDEVGAEFPRLKATIAKDNFIKIMPDLKAFLTLYAKDGGGFPPCGE